MSSTNSKLARERNMKYGEKIGVVRIRKDQTGNLPVQVRMESTSTIMTLSTQSPEIPDVCPELKALINNIHQTNNVSANDRALHNKRLKARLTKPGGRSKQKTKLNGFMAYRAYHARHVLGNSSQRGLSVAIAKFWAEDKNQLIWSRYATEYNLSETKQPFVEWLIESKKKPVLEQRNELVRSDYNSQDNKVFIEWKQKDTKAEQVDKKKKKLQKKLLHSKKESINKEEWENNLAEETRVENICLKDGGETRSTANVSSHLSYELPIPTKDPFQNSTEFSISDPIDPIIINLDAYDNRQMEHIHSIF